jgi:hypothetical protein
VQAQVERRGEHLSVTMAETLRLSAKDELRIEVRA